MGEEVDGVADHLLPGVADGLWGVGVCHLMVEEGEGVLEVSGLADLALCPARDLPDYLLRRGDRDQEGGGGVGGGTP